MFGLSLTELLVILAIVLLLFGTRKLRNLGGDLGGAIKGFRNAMSDDAASGKESREEPKDSNTPYIEGEAEREAPEQTRARAGAPDEQDR